MWQRSVSTLLGVTAALVAACDNQSSVLGNVTADKNGAHTVNGSVQVPAGIKSGAVGTVNGSIHIGDDATVGSASTVNGAIDLGTHAGADSVDTVNGSVTLATGAHVAHSLSTVNGSVNLASDTELGGDARNVNGHIVLTAAHVTGSLSTVSGDIDVMGSSRVEGGITVQKSNSWFGLSWASHRPRIVIGPGAVVQGTLRFERPVDLYVSETATIGPVTGATAIRYSGAAPAG
jgi:DUF4097 and DUF4098 domain-containing protein YvlB